MRFTFWKCPASKRHQTACLLTALRTRWSESVEMLRDTIEESRINVIYEWSKAKDIWKRKKNGRHCEGFNDFRLKGNERNLISFAGPGHWMWWIGADVKTWTRKTEQKGKKTHTHKQEKSLRRKTRDGFLATVPSTIVYSAWVKCQIGKCQKNDGGPMSLALAKGHHHQKIWKSLLFEIKKVEKRKKGQMCCDVSSQFLSSFADRNQQDYRHRVSIIHSQPLHSTFTRRIIRKALSRLKSQSKWYSFVFSYNKPIKIVIGVIFYFD